MLNLVLVYFPTASAGSAALMFVLHGFHDCQVVSSMAGSHDAMLGRLLMSVLGEVKNKERFK